MIAQKPSPQLIWAILIVLLIAGCSAPTPTPTSIPPSPSPTSVPPTLTAVPFTATALPSVTPTSTALPDPQPGPNEQVAQSIEQVAGKWAMRVMGGGEGDPAVFSLNENGTHSINGIGGGHEGMNLGTGTFQFEGDVFVLQSPNCLRTGGAEMSPSEAFYTCTAYYYVYVTMIDGVPSTLRFAALYDPHGDRRLSLDKWTLTRYSE